MLTNGLAGGAVISYYLPSILETVGITDSKQQLLMNALNNVFSFCGGIVGAFFVDNWGRRPLMLTGIFVTGLVYIPINVLAALSNGRIDASAGYAFIGMLFLYGIVSSFCITPLQALYPAEILSNDIRCVTYLLAFYLDCRVRLLTLAKGTRNRFR